MKLRFGYCLVLSLWLVIGTISCQTSYTILKKDYEQTTINAVLPEDSFALKLIKPYKDSLDKEMLQVIANSRVILKKEQPEGTLCNWVCDALMDESKALKPDLCVLNYGGLRIPQISEGPVTRGKIFELMPFDNYLVLLYISGNKLQELLNLTASKKGWPVAGLQMQLENGKAVSIFINGEALKPAKTYRLLTNDYIANGGDNCSMLLKVPSENTNLLIREVLLNYCAHLQQKGEKISSSKDGRVY